MQALLKEFDAKDINRVWFSLFREAQNSVSKLPSSLSSSNPTNSEVDLYHLDESLKIKALKLFNSWNIKTFLNEKKKK